MSETENRNDTGSGSKETPDQRKERLKKEKERLLSQLAAGDLSTKKAKVAFVLNHYPETRDSDIKLTWLFWRIFQSHLIEKGSTVSEDQMLKLEPESTIKRWRAKIQNEYELFLGSEDVRAQRRNREDEFRLTMLDDKPGVRVVDIHADESGKNQRFAVVGSMWISDGFRKAQLWRDLTVWKSDHEIKSEFHFADLTRQNVTLARAFYDVVLGQSDFISFKAVAVEQSDMRRTQDEIAISLYYQLIYKGIQHEQGTGRLALPRQVDVWKDSDDGTDRILLEKLRQELSDGLNRHFGDQAWLGALQPVDSKKDFFIQIADLFTGSVNRVLNGTNSRNHKNEFADHVLSSLGIRLFPEEMKAECERDTATVMFL